MAPGRRLVLLVLLLSLLAMLVPGSQLAFGQKSPSVVVRLFPDGWAEVKQVVLGDPEVGAVNVTLLSGSVENLLVVSEDGTPLTYTKSGSTLTVISLGYTAINVSYYTDALTSKTGSIWTASINTSTPTTIVLLPSILLLQVSPLPSSVSVTDNLTVLSFDSGPVTVYYSVVPGPQSKPPAPTPKPGFALSLSLPLVIGVVVVVAAITALLLIRGGKKSLSLRPDDARVLDLVKKEGPLPESEISRRLAIPRTTTSRIVRRLERMGLVKVEKAGGVNLVKAAS